MSEQTEEKTEPTAAEKAAEAITGTPVEKAEETPAPEPEKPAEEPKPEPAADERLLKNDGKPYTKADIDGLQTALKAARKDAKDHKAALDDLKAKGGDRPLDEVLAEATSTADAKWKPIVVRAAARAAFAEAGLALPEGRQDEALARAVRLLDEDSLTIADTGVVDGLAEQVESIRTDFPDLFATATQRKPRIQAADRPSGPKPPAGAAERLAAQLTGGR